MTASGTRSSGTPRATDRPAHFGTSAMEEQFMQRSVDWEPGCVVAVDQTTLPHEMTVLHMTSIDQIITAIQRLAIRGAPALGLAGGLGVALSAHLRSVDDNVDHAAVRADAELLAAARPTAVNLRWGVDRALGRLADGPDAVLQEALDMISEDERTNRAAATRAAALIREVSPRRPLHVLTHCNTGRLATGGWGTALGAIRELAAGRDLGSVLATETRPLLQGARLTVWELAEAGIPHRLCIDSAAAAAMARGLVDCVIVGADRIAANGDTANKIGTYALAVAAARHDIPFVVVAPESSVDVTTPHGDDILIEDRPADEVLEISGAQIAQPGTAVYNPAFDVTPIDLITAIVTEDRIIRPTRTGDTPPIRHAAAHLAREARELYLRGWLEGTSGNLSTRLDDATILVTTSGRSKGRLTESDTVPVSVRTGTPVRADGPKPSAETSIHAAIYAADPRCGAVIHVHSPHATAVAVLAARANRTSVRFVDLELIKGGPDLRVVERRGCCGGRRARCGFRECRHAPVDAGRPVGPHDTLCLARRIRRHARPDTTRRPDRSGSGQCEPAVGHR
ncbi:S-methyl-5-thioribose-1-phosphate isomerase [Micromonospora sp. WMMD1120]|uniref:S-methyl-5-thioribose-1-phosphate isomerase n=1 Tax=Micromonospora sp. WMMD1120 TaxID=3016106 RepID=UPI0024166B86|nr:S-methyl-5-thioribose-1-phosphate isomerase [Micromonospora sp. WMMD1120]MDG4810994.1 S-methyl-5-thioribose-1-phosphate isomerase [Micromonospora sp. WMMD1120]